MKLKKKPTRTLPKRSIVKQARRDPDRAEQAATPPSDSPAVMAAKDAEQQAVREARQAHKALDVARQDADRAAKALNVKEMEVTEVKAKLATVSQQLGALSLDDVKAEKLGGQLRHCELRASQLQGEAGGARETCTVAQRHASTLEEAAARAEAALRNAGRWVRLQVLSEAFPLALERLLAVVRERTTVLHEADQESHGSGLARVGRARLFPTRDQIRGPSMDDLLTILSRHMAGLALTPSAPLSAFALDGQVSPEREPDGEPVEEWVPVTAEGGTEDG